jgi:hypothetical protein
MGTREKNDAQPGVGGGEKKTQKTVTGTGYSDSFTV